VITAVDTNILIDILEPDPIFGPASRDALKKCLQEGSLVACDIVWAEVATAYGHAIEKLRDALEQMHIVYSPMSQPATLEAAKCWYRYRSKHKGRDRIVADFLIGGHALKQANRLLTRDRGFYRQYFRSLKIVKPV
jgi:predicted nucleic acid-binding protein